MKKATMRDIGKAVGVSAVTVSKALAGKPGMSEAMRGRIEKKAQEMGYVYPGAARMIPNQHLDIGILIPEAFFDANSFYANLYKRLVQQMTGAGHYAVLELIGRSAEEGLELPKILENRRVNGLILLGQPRKEYYRMIAEQEIPVVFLDFYDEQASADAVVGDNSYGCYRLTSHLIKNGHRRIGFVGNYRATSSIMDRFLGYSKALLEAGIEVRMDWVLEDRFGKTTPAVPRMPKEMPEAFLCSCDDTAYTVVETLKRMGYRIPEDVAVAGYDDYHIAQFCSPQLTTYRVNVQAMARHAATQLIRRIKKKTITHGNMVVCGEVILREST